VCIFCLHIRFPHTHAHHFPSISDRKREREICKKKKKEEKKKKKKKRQKGKTARKKQKGKNEKRIYVLNCCIEPRILTL
jgi:hypothetical protein